MVENRQIFENTFYTFYFEGMYGRIPSNRVLLNPIKYLYHTEVLDIFVW